jgi:hypothetical protein
MINGSVHYLNLRKTKLTKHRGKSLTAVIIIHKHRSPGSNIQAQRGHEMEKKNLNYTKSYQIDINSSRLTTELNSIKK